VATLTNPNGPDPSKYLPDEYPFFEAAYELPTYGLLWIGDDHRDVHLALTGEIQGAMDAIRDDVPRGITVFFHLVEYTDDELCAFRDEVMEDRDDLTKLGILITGGGCGNIEHRVKINISPATPEVLAYMRSRYDGPIDYEAGGSYALSPVSPPDVEHLRLEAIRADELNLMSCGRRPFPAASLDDLPVAVDTQSEEFDALREGLSIYRNLYGDLSQLDWILAEKDTFGATFLADRGDTWLEAPVIAGTERWAPTTIDYCTPESIGIIGGSASVHLDRDFPKPGPEANELHLLVHEGACASGSNPASRILPAIVSYTDSSVIVSIEVRPVSGYATCPGNPRLPVTVVLPEPLGDRELRGVTTSRD
jgi:hypothetical protein